MVYSTVWLNDMCVRCTIILHSEQVFTGVRPKRHVISRLLESGAEKEMKKTYNCNIINININMKLKTRYVILFRLFRGGSSGAE